MTGFWGAASIDYTSRSNITQLKIAGQGRFLQ
jgi:hypothetical protein